MKFNLRQIEVFRAIMMAGSISGAARLLSVSQPAISRLLAYTEDRLKMRLFERIKGRVQPTPEARRLFAEVEEVHRGVLRVNDLAQELTRRGTGALHVVASPSVAQALIPVAIQRFRQIYPEVFLQLEVLTLRELIDRVAARRVDVGFSGMPVHDPTLDAKAIVEGRLSVICRRDHPLAGLQTIKLEELRGYPLIGYNSQTPYGDLVAKAIADSGIEIRFDTVVRYTPVACSLVQAGVGVAIADDFVIGSATSASDLVARPIDPVTRMHVYALSSRLEPMSRLAKVFVSTVEDVSKEIHNPTL